MDKRYVFFVQKLTKDLEHLELGVYTSKDVKTDVQTVLGEQFNMSNPSNYSKTKSTKRFTYTVSRNATAKAAGSNIVTIATNSSDSYYSTGTSSLTMTVKEAIALQSFLNDTLVTE